MSQLGFAESFLGSGIGRNTRLEKIDDLLDWDSIDRLLNTALTSQTGRPPYRPLSMFKALLLQQWYGLSDPGLEEALLDRLSFRRFCALPLDADTPDETTLCRFRNRLVDEGLGDVLFAQISDQFETLGLIVKTGTLIDATLVEASVRPPADTPADQRPANAPHSVNPLDEDATWRSQGKGGRHFGYKAHIGVDQTSGLIRRRRLTGARAHDSSVADSLICGDEKAVYADKAYEQKARRDGLKQRGAKDRIMHKRNKHHDLTHWQKIRNKLIKPIRAPVENIFGSWKRLYGYRRVRYRGLKKNALQLDLLAIAFNLRRAQALM